MPTVEINYLAILASAVIYMALGFLWYGPFFGKPWMKLVGMNPKDMTKEQKAAMGKTYAISFIGALIMAYVLAYFIRFTLATTIEAGVITGFWAWLGFVATTGANEFLFAVKPKPWTLYLINQGYILVSLLIVGGLLAVWR